MDYFKLILLTAILCISIVVQGTPESKQVQFNDTTMTELIDSTNSVLDFHSNYLAQSEVEHQKLMRNIFAISFGFILLLLIFTIVYYGGKIKKVSNIIVMQNDAVNSSKDQLIKIINIFNYIDLQVYITDSKGNVEWLNTFAANWFKEDIEKEKVSLLNKFSAGNQALVFQGINDSRSVQFKEELLGQGPEWKMIPVKNSKNEFSNMVFIGANS